ncbi:unnamed protein product [Calicophoron daubneyi]|uniref:Uncharacterized protein n=1 Tax=Calicophoron daubneyi TaxID=300641 RepID=A0AAV2T968_CALDB
MMTWARFSQLFMGVDVPLGIKQRMTGGFYRGSRLLDPISRLMNVPLDQINYVFSGLVALGLGCMMRRRFSPARTSPRTRALLETIFGLFILSFCFGNQLRVLLLQNTVAYILMLCLPTNRVMAVLVTVWSMFYMSLVHLCRWQYDYGGYTVDISGPVMVQTQRLSSLAFNLADGALIREHERRKTVKRESPTSLPSDVNDITTTGLGDETASDQAFRRSLKSSFMKRLRSFTDVQNLLPSERAALANGGPIQAYLDRLLKGVKPSSRRSNRSDAFDSMLPSHIENAVYSVPGPIEFFSYMLYFHGACVGPFVFYSEYRSYLEGYGGKVLPPIDWRYLTTLFIRTLSSGLLSAYAAPYAPFDFVLTSSFQAWPLLKRVFYATISLFLVRQKYYFAWGLAEVDGIGTGMGFSGYCPNTGRPRYDKVRSFDFGQVESGLSLKNAIDNWNISTTRWLRAVFYDRLPASCRTVPVFVVSAIWHGFYPGYYLMFSAFALFTLAARTWHRAIRPLCRRNPWSIWLYDIFTMIATNMTINYGQAPFHLLDLSSSLIVWKAFYFIPHIVTCLILIVRFVQPRLRRSVNYGRLKSPVSLGRMVGG